MMNSISLLKVFLTVLLAAIVSPCQPEGPIAPAQIDHAFTVYGKAWGEPDIGKRAELLAQVWAKDGQYRDPTVALTGAKALSLHIGEFLQQYPQAKITMTSKIDSYGSTFRAHWFLDFGDGKTAALEGLDFGELNNEGRIAKITGFFGPLRKEEVAKNEAIVDQYLKSLFTKFDPVGLDKVLSPDVVYTQAAGLPYGGTFHGLPEMMTMYQKSAKYSRMLVADGWTLATNPATKKVIASFTVHCIANKSGKAIDMAIQESFELRDGKIIGITPFYFDTKIFGEFLNETSIMKDRRRDH
jgi:ketosteroid isomerase-like protein